MKRLLISTLFTLTLISASSAMARTSADDFVKNAAIGGKFEIESSKVALNRSHDDQVKGFAQMMIDDHSKLADQLKSTASSAGLDPQLADSPLDHKHQKMLDKLNKTSDTDFNAKYLSEQKDAHKEAIKLFSTYAKKGDNDALKNFAANTLPTLKHHQDSLSHINLK